MHASAPAGTQALDRAFALLASVAEDGGASTIAAIAQAQQLPLSTAHRMVGRMAACGLLVRVARGRYRAGLGLARLSAQADPRTTAMAVARPLLRGLARQTGRTAHLGILEADMVTYLIKETPARAQMFTREAMQLEAYCSAIGKVLLARLPPVLREAYLRQDSFVALTPRTIVQPDALRRHLAQAAAQAFALDEEEIAPGLYCIAVPVAWVEGLPAMAISVAGPPPQADAHPAILQALRQAADTIAARLGTRPPGPALVDTSACATERGRASNPP